VRCLRLFVAEEVEFEIGVVLCHEPLEVISRETGLILAPRYF
jgi:hypothetical protein